MTDLSNLISLARSKRTEVRKQWGKEIWLVNNANYCGKLLYVNRHASCSVHYHENKHETFYLLEGQIIMRIATENDLKNAMQAGMTEKEAWLQGGVVSERLMDEGDSLIIPQGLRHQFEGLTKQSIIVEFSTHHEDSDSYRIAPGKAA